VEHLRVLGCDTWHDSLLHGGQDWWEEILRRIADCDTFIAVISRDALSSMACRREFEWAESLDKPVLPVAVEPPPKALPRRFLKLQIVDYSDPEARDRAALTLGGGLATLPAAPGLPDPLPEPPLAPLSSLTDFVDLVTYQLIDLVTQKDALDHDQQRHILNQLERVLRSVDPEQRRDGRDILEMFSGRDDLYPDVDCTTTILRITTDQLRITSDQPVSVRTDDTDEQATTRLPSTGAEGEPSTAATDIIVGGNVLPREKTERSAQEQQPGANRTPIREHPAAPPSDFQTADPAAQSKHRTPPANAPAEQAPPRWLLPGTSAHPAGPPRKMYRTAAPPLRQRLGHVSRLRVFRGVDRRKIVLGALTVRRVIAGFAVWDGKTIVFAALTVWLVLAGVLVWAGAGLRDQAPANLERPPTISESETWTLPPPTVEPTSAAGVPWPGQPRQVTYSVTGTKDPVDVITVTFVDAGGFRRTQHPVIIPWSLTLRVPESVVLSVEASSQSRASKLNCSITADNGKVLASNDSNAPQTSC
jgi:hypothetical protein